MENDALIGFAEMRYSTNRPTMYGPTHAFNPASVNFPSMHAQTERTTLTQCELCSRLFVNLKEHRCPEFYVEDKHGTK